jgi:hypothetical protein
MILIAGKIGKGKSTLGLQVASLSCPNFDMSKVCYVPPRLFRRLGKCDAGESNLIDEGGNFFKGRNSMTKIGRDISQAFQLVRDLKQILIVCYDEPEKLDKDIIDKFDTLFVKLYNPEEKGDRQYKDYLAFTVKAMDKVKVLLKQKIPVTDPQITRFANWKGHNSIEIPIINDVNEEIYRSEKRKFLRDHMNMLAEKWAEEYQEVDKKDKEDKTPENKINIEDKYKGITRTIRAADYAKAKGIGAEAVANHLKKGLLKGEKFGRMWLVHVEQ